MMNKLLPIITCAVIFLQIEILGEIYKLKGKVISELDSNMVCNALIVIKGNNSYCQTDSAGEFYFDNIKTDEIEIVISKVGYYNYYAVLKLDKYQTNYFLFILRYDLLGINNYFYSLNKEGETLTNSPNNLMVFDNLNNYTTFKYLDYFDLFSQLHVIKNNRGMPFIFKRGIINNFRLQIDNAIIPRDYYSELLMFLPVDDNERLEIGNMQNAINYNNSFGGFYSIINKIDNTGIKITGIVNTQENNNMGINITNIFRNINKNIDSIKSLAVLNYYPNYKYDNYTQYNNANIRYTGEIFFKNNFSNHLSIVFNRLINLYNPPVAFNYRNKNNYNSNLLVGSLLNKFKTGKKSSLVIFNNYSLTDKNNGISDYGEYKLSNLISQLYYQNNYSQFFNYAFGIENIYEKISFNNINNGYKSTNISKLWGYGEYKLPYGKISLDMGMEKYYEKNIYYSYSCKLKIFTSLNSNMLLGYSVKYSPISVKDAVGFDYNYYGQIIKANYNLLKPYKNNILEAVFSYSDNDLYYLKISFYNEIITNVLTNSGLTEQNNLLSPNKYFAKFDVNTVDLFIKLLPIKKVKAGLYFYSSKINGENIFTIFRPENEITGFIEYSPLSSTAAELYIKHFGEIEVSDEIAIDKNISLSNNFKTYNLSSLTVIDFVLNQKIKDFNISLALKNILNKEMQLYRDSYPTSITLSLGYLIKY